MSPERSIFRSTTNTDRSADRSTVWRPADPLVPPIEPLDLLAACGGRIAS